jgi:hypothetical protein
VSACAAKEISLRLPVSFFDVSTKRAAARGVAGVNPLHFDAVQPCFVGDKRLKLIEAPMAALCPVLAPDPGPQVDARQIFESNTLLRAFSLSDKLLTDAVINMALKTSLFASQLTQTPSGRLRPDLLQFLPAAGDPLAPRFNLFALEYLTVAVCGKVDDASIYAQPTIAFGWRRIVNLTRRQQVPLAAMVHQIALAVLMLHQFALRFSAHVWHALSSWQRPDRSNLLVGAVLQNTTVIGDCPMFFEVALGCPIQLVAICHFRQAAHDQLRRQREVSPHRVVQRSVQVVLIEDLVVPGLVADRIARGVRSLKAFFEPFGLLWRRFKLKLSNQFHALSITRNSIIGKDEERIPPLDKSRGLLRNNL